MLLKQLTLIVFILALKDVISVRLPSGFKHDIKSKKGTHFHKQVFVYSVKLPV